MRYVDLKTWPRREHFKVLGAWRYPHFSMCANVDLTAFYPAVKERGVSFNVAIIYLLARAANAIREFRYRIRAKGVVEHEIVHPSATILTSGDLFSFCQFDYAEDFSVFSDAAEKKIAYMLEHPTVEDEPGRDDLLFMTAIPWVSFTSVIHPFDLDHVVSVPRFAWGKYFEDGDSLKMPLNVQGHHGVMDGVHMGRFYTEVQEYMRGPGLVLDGA